jgi:hypothetical protein
MYEDLTETQWRGVVVDLARNYGWRAFYVEQSTREIQTARRGRVRVRNINVGGQGFPDLVMVRGRDRRLIFAELKREKRPTRGAHSGGSHPITGEQNEWLTDLNRVADGAAQGSGFPAPIEVFVWRPSDYNDVERILR